MELLTRSRYLLLQSGDKWSEKQQMRADLPFGLHPKIKEAYSLLCSQRSVFKDKKLDRESGKVKLHEWYQKVNDSTLREIKAARDLIKLKENGVLNHIFETLGRIPATFAILGRLRYRYLQVRTHDDSCIRYTPLGHHPTSSLYTFPIV